MSTTAGGPTEAAGYGTSTTGDPGYGTSTTGATGYGASSTPGDAPAPGVEASIGEMLGNVTRDVSTLMRQEVELAKAEARQSATKAGKGVGFLSGAGVAGLLTLIFLSLALMWLLGDGLFDIGLGWGALIVGILWAIVAAILLSRGRRELKDVSMQQTADSAKKIPEALKGNET